MKLTSTCGGCESAYRTARATSSASSGAATGTIVITVPVTVAATTGGAAPGTPVANTASVTGAVGLLDRVAPLCFAAPVFFHFVQWYFHLYK